MRSRLSTVLSARERLKSTVAGIFWLTLLRDYYTVCGKEIPRCLNIGCYPPRLCPSPTTTSATCPRSRRKRSSGAHGGLTVNRCVLTAANQPLSTHAAAVTQNGQSGANRFRCKTCGRDFSVTTGTQLAWHKMSFKEMLHAILSFCNNVEGRQHLR